MIPELRLFGGAVLVSAEGVPVKGAAAQSRRLAVLTVLAEAWPGTATRDRVIGLIWPEQDAAGARRLLTQALYEVRRELGPVIAGTARDLAIDPDALRVDVIEFRRAVRAGELEAAASVYGGPLLAGFHLRGAAEFERWLDDARESLRRDLQRALESLSSRAESEGGLRDAARWAERVVQISPFDADAVLRAMQLLATAGDHGGALAVAATYERRMRDELELEPAPQVRQLVESLRASVSSGVAAQPVASAADAGSAPPPPPPLPITGPPSVPPGSVRTDRGSSNRTALRIGVAITVAALGVAVAARISASRAPERVLARRLTIAPFTVPAGDTTAERIARGVTSALAAALRGADGLRLASETDSLPWSDGEQAWGTLRGQLVRSGQQLRIDAELRLDADSAHPTAVSVAGSRDSVLALTERLAIGVLPALYSSGGGSLPAVTLARFASAATLRRFLDGEAALRSGDFDSAFASFKRVTELAPALAYPWYRRALAAEMAHRSDDADRSIAAAESRVELLEPRERQLVHGYARWRAGDARGADTIFRAMLRADSRDREAWFHLAEIDYHAGPLHGRPVDEARDAWRRVVALDSGNYSALVHALRLEARAGDRASVTTLLRHAPLSASTAPSAVESRVIAAYANGSPASIASVRADLDTLPDYSLGFLQGMVAGLLERPAQAEAIARRLTKPTYPQAVQAEGHLALAHLSMARGRWREASRELRVAERSNPVTAAWSRAYFVTLPFVDFAPARRDEALMALTNAPTNVTTAPMSLQLAVDVPAAGMIERYLHGLLAISSMKSEVPRLQCPGAGEVAPSTRALCEDLQRGLRAESLRRAGQDVASLRELESLDMLVPYQFAGRSMFFARSRERYLRATLLERAGRLQEADDWYAAVPHGSWMDYIYLAPTHLRRGAIRERLGDVAGAADQYRRVLALWDDPDPELYGLRREAEAGLARTSARSGR